MPISVKLTTNTALITDIRRLPSVMAKWSQRISNTAIRKWSPPMMNELRFYPPPPSFPVGAFPWKSGKQKRYVMALLRRQAIARGDFVIGPRGGQVVTDLRYQRNFELQKGWTLNISTSPSLMVMSVSNSASSAKFVVGTLNQRSVREAIVPQQPFHRGRWTPAAATTQKYLKLMISDYSSGISKVFGKEVETISRRRSKI